jgi:hypothetical protein
MIKWGNERHINVCALFLNNSRLTERCSVVPLIEPAGVTPGYCDPQEGEVSSLLKGGSGHTEPALAMRQFSLDGKRVEGVCEGNAEPETLNYRRREEAPITVRML